MKEERQSVARRHLDPKALRHMVTSVLSGTPVSFTIQIDIQEVTLHVHLENTSGLSDSDFGETAAQIQFSLYQASFQSLPEALAGEIVIEVHTGPPQSNNRPHDDPEECSSCEEGLPPDDCPKSHRPCGHHCNHSWSADHCCWCGATFGEDDPNEANEVYDDAFQAHENLEGTDEMEAPPETAPHSQSRFTPSHTIDTCPDCKKNEVRLWTGLHKQSYAMRCFHCGFRGPERSTEIEARHDWAQIVTGLEMSTQTFQLPNRSEASTQNEPYAIVSHILERLEDRFPDHIRLEDGDCESADPADWIERIVDRMLERLTRCQECGEFLEQGTCPEHHENHFQNSPQ